MFIVDLFKPQCRLEAENLFLRQQLSIALRRACCRCRLGTKPNSDIRIKRGSYDP